MKPTPRAGSAGRTWARLALVPLLAGAGLVLTVPTAPSASAGTTLGSAAAEKGRYFGTATNSFQLSNTQYVTILNREFNSIVAENEMKWDATEPNQGQFAYARGDRLVAHAQANRMTVRGHALLWHQQQPRWAQNLSGSALRNAAINHVTQVATHFRGKIHSWDVANASFTTSHE